MIFIEIMKELYQEGKVSIEKLNDLLNKNKITEKQYKYIISE